MFAADNVNEEKWQKLFLIYDINQDELLTWEEVWKLFKYRENFKPKDSEKPIVPVKPQPVKPISPPV